jgi:isopropylmalate/homocitrate/citramalate synthase
MSGGTVVRNKLEELGLSATKEQVAKIVDSVKREAIIRKWSITEDLFENIAKSILNEK